MYGKRGKYISGRKGRNWAGGSPRLKMREELDRLGMEYGWVQDLESPGHYCPDFARSHPFAK